MRERVSKCAGASACVYTRTRIVGYFVCAHRGVRLVTVCSVPNANGHNRRNMRLDGHIPSASAVSNTRAPLFFLPSSVRALGASSLYLYARIHIHAVLSPSSSLPRAFSLFLSLSLSSSISLSLPSPPSPPPSLRFFVRDATRSHGAIQGVRSN